MQDQSRAEQAVIARVCQRLGHECTKCRVHAAHDDPRQKAGQNAQRQRAYLVAQEGEQCAEVVAQIAAQRSKDRKAKEHRDGNRAKADKNGLEDARNDFVQAFFQIIRAQGQQQCRKQRTGITHQTNRDTKEVYRVTRSHQLEPVVVQQRCRTDHCIDRGRTQLAGSTVSHKDGHEIERCIGYGAEQSVSIGRCKTGGCQRDEQQHDLEHTACDQTGDHRGDSGRHKAYHTQCGRFYGERLLLLGSIQIFVQVLTGNQVVFLEDCFIHRQKVLPQNDHILTAV